MKMHYTVLSILVVLSTASICLLVLSCTPLERCGYILGYLYRTNYDDQLVPVENVKIEILELNISTGTDSLGRFVFSGLESGYYTINYSGRGSYSDACTRDSVQVVIADTTYVNMQISRLPEESYRFSWNSPYIIHWINLDFEISVPEGQSAEGLLVYTREIRCPVHQISEDMYSVMLPYDFDVVHWSLPWLGMQSTRIRD